MRPEIKDGGMTIEVRVPTLGESVTEATIASWFKQPGEAVAADEMLCELETDKVTIEVPAPVAGVLGDHVAKAGDTVGVNGLLGTIEEGAAAAPAIVASAAPAPAAAAAVAPAPAPATTAPAPAKDVEDAPSAKKLMAEAGLAAGQVQGTGRDGRVMKEDVLNAVAAAAAAPDTERATLAALQKDNANQREGDEHVDDENDYEHERLASAGRWAPGAPRCYTRRIPNCHTNFPSSGPGNREEISGFKACAPNQGAIDIVDGEKLRGEVDKFLQTLNAA